MRTTGGSCAESLSRYLKGTRGLKLTLRTDNIGFIKWWIDASYAVHEDCKGQTGAMMSMGEGATTSGSWRQKLNARSSTEGELIGMHDVLPQVLWSKHFIEAQGYTVEHNVVYQDNKSAILLENNGVMSSSKRTKHIQSRYFYVKDCIERQELTVEHCPTEEMWCDVLTKPKQGLAFRRDRAMLMNCPVDWEDDGSHDPVNEEHAAVQTDARSENGNTREGDRRSAKRLRQRAGRGRIFQRASPQECVGGVPKQ